MRNMILPCDTLRMLVDTEKEIISWALSYTAQNGEITLDEYRKATAYLSTLTEG